MKARNWMMALAVSAGLCSTSLANIAGTAKFDGEPPEAQQIDMAAVKECAAQHPDGAFDDSVVIGENNELAGVVVSVKAAEGQELAGEAPKGAVTLDQKGCQYTPHIIAMMTGQQMIVKNSDKFLHNVHSLALDNPAFNFGQPTIDPGKKVPDPMKVAERFKIKCDVHPWMNAQVSVFEHPFFAVTKEDGTFTIPGELPDGKYTLVAWHEKFGEQEQEVEVKDGKLEGVEFTFKAEAAAADPAELGGAEVKLAVLQDKAATPKVACTACCEKDKAAKTLVKGDAKVSKGIEPQAAAK